ncbi:phenylcoumaran benzylic ether reductase Pyrc5-like [Zingiber officinale]|uniref:phenylcoumaran benzylic ether reductase Pyrc5-like n=1 Tax=Zingiber officinale TaxID=94328 RepID=UPI001C4B1D93|nr:phenylcoumaran benzylic ether reductase Pyrc5-like [Zingiber officinale]
MGEREEKSKILIIGGTGRVGSLIVACELASKQATPPSSSCGHPPSFLIHGSLSSLTLSRGKAPPFSTYGDLGDYDSLKRAIKQVDVVISAVGHEGRSEVKGQLMLLDAIQQAGNRFYPSEFGNDLEQVRLVEPAKSMLAHKLVLRQAMREKGIPHTIVCNFFFHGFYLPRLGQAEATSAHTDGKVFISGDGNTKAIFVNEVDVAKYTIRSVDDPVTLNKVLYVRPHADRTILASLIPPLFKEDSVMPDSMMVMLISPLREDSVMLSLVMVKDYAADASTKRDSTMPSSVNVSSGSTSRTNHCQWINLP